MAENNSVHGSSLRRINDRVIIVQVLIILFLCINLLLIVTFFKKDFFYTNMRYILFATTLLSDSVTLIITDFLLIFSFFRIHLHMCFCLIIFIVASVYVFVTPVTLTAMCLERYVAICMPLRHADLCFRGRALHCVVIIHGLSSVSCFVVLSTFFSAAPVSLFKEKHICTVELFLIQNWQRDLRSAVGQFFFSIMFIIIVFCYFEIIKVAKSASGVNMKATWKALRTIILHTFQLLLCLCQLFSPFFEQAVLKIDFKLFVQVRFFNYLMFNLLPRCLSPLIYGLRDDKFFLALKYYVLCHSVDHKSVNLAKLQTQS